MDEKVTIKDMTDLQGVEGRIQMILEDLQKGNEVLEGDLYFLALYATKAYRKNVGREFVEGY
jgi:hypothetical protein